MIEVELPDGSIAEFPDGTPQGTIKTALLKRTQAAAPKPQGSYLDAGVTWLENAITGIPVVGPAIQKGSDFLGTEVLGRISGQDPAQMRQGLAESRSTRNEQYPMTALSGSLAGGIGAMGGVGAIPGGARALGMTGASLAGRAGNSALSGGLISGADSVARGGSPEGVTGSAAIGAGIGGAIPVVGAGISSALGAAGSKIAPIVNSIRNPGQEAERRVGMALQRDRLSDPSGLATPVDEVVAQRSGIPMLNADRGGETTRALARSVANQSPEARGVIERTASDRFGAQSQRAAETIRRVAGGSVDDLAYQENIRATARAVNRPAYKKAYEAPRAQAMWHEGFEQLMQAPALQRAAMQATSRGANRAAVEGFQPVRNPFEMVNGRMTLKQNPDGTQALPNLQFWDQVKRNLDGMIGRAQRSGDNAIAGDLNALRGQLLNTLDNTVPEYRTARRGAAEFFDAEDALDAGKNFANQPRSIPETKRAYQQFAPAEREAFATGYASELIDRIKVSGDRSNVINSVFKSQASRESMELVFGPQKMRELEAYVRVEDLADRLRGAMGNSTTARQLVELGIGAGGGGMMTGDWQGAVAGAAAAKGIRYLGQRIDDTVMQRVAQMLTSDNPKMLELAVQQATRNPDYMLAIEYFGNVLAAPSRGVGLTVAQ